MQRLGAGRAGLLTGVAPISAALTGMALGGPAPQPLVWLGVAAVAAALGLGLTTRRPAPAAAPAPTRLVVSAASGPGSRP